VNSPAQATSSPVAAGANTSCRQSGRIPAPEGISFWQEYQNSRRTIASTATRSSNQGSVPTGRQNSGMSDFLARGCYDTMTEGHTGAREPPCHQEPSI
jgi:hypothetical protein